MSIEDRPRLCRKKKPPVFTSRRLLTWRLLIKGDFVEFEWSGFDCFDGFRGDFTICLWLFPMISNGGQAASM